MKNEEEAELFRHEVEEALQTHLHVAGYGGAAAWILSHTLESSWAEMVEVIQQCAQARYASSRKERPEWHVRVAKNGELLCELEQQHVTNWTARSGVYGT